MATCIKAPTVAEPELPFPLSFQPPKISFSFNPQSCCKLPSYNPKIPINLPPIIISPLLPVLKKSFALINGVLGRLTLKCGRN